MLVGLVKKNGIMMIDFAIEARRRDGLSAADAIYEACRVRFRPIMMTTMAALMGTLPIALGFGAGSEARRPLGLAVVGGLLVSQTLTLYVTPVFYIYMEHFQEWLAGRKAVRVGGPPVHGRAGRRLRARGITPHERPDLISWRQIRVWRRMNKSRPTFLKREREKKKRERQQMKTARRAEVSAQKSTAPDRADGEDPDIAGIRLGPQPPLEEVRLPGTGIPETGWGERQNGRDGREPPRPQSSNPTGRRAPTWRPSGLRGCWRPLAEPPPCSTPPPGPSAR